MCVSAKVFDGVAKSVEGFLDVRAPVFLIKTVLPFVPLIRILKVFAGSGKRKRSTFVVGIQVSKVFSLELITQDFYRNEKPAFGFTDFLVGGKPSAGNNTVDVHMVIQFLIPGMENLNDAWCCAEILLIP